MIFQRWGIMLILVRQINSSHNILSFRLLDNTESIERSGRKLNIGQSLLNETEDIGAAILNDLSGQRETISNARRKVSGNKTMTKWWLFFAPFALMA